MPWADDNLAYVRHGTCGFLVQAVSELEFSAQFQMHLQLKNLDDWYAQVITVDIAGRLHTTVTEPADQTWDMRDFTLVDPGDVLWRIAQNTLPPQH